MNVPDLTQQSIDYTLAGLRKYNYITRNDLACHQIRDAVATNRSYFADRSYVGAVYDGGRNLVRSTLRFNQGDIFPVDGAILDDISALSARRSEHPYALYGGILFPILGHFFFESVARLWPLLWRRQNNQRQLPLYFHHWPGLDMNIFTENRLYMSTLESFGVSRDDIQLIDQPIQFDNLIVPDPASTYHLNLDHQMINIFDTVAETIIGSHQPSERSNRIYLSRSQWMENRRIINEDAIDQIMISRGITVIHTEMLSPAELMSTLKNADLVVASDGSHAHLTAFCQSGIKIILLDTRPVPTQFAISILKNFSALHIPLFQTPLYKQEQGITDLAVLEKLIDAAIERQQSMSRPPPTAPSASAPPTASRSG